MAQQETAFLRQTAILWPASGPDTFGQITVGAPTEIKVRWNDRQSERLDRQGNTITLDADVIVAQDITIGSQMWLGTLDDWYGHGSGTGSGAVDDQLMQVKTFNATPDIKRRVSFRTAGLMRLRGSH